VSIIRAAQRKASDSDNGLGRARQVRLALAGSSPAAIQKIGPREGRAPNTGGTNQKARGATRKGYCAARRKWSRHKTSPPSAGIRPRPAKEQELVRAAKFYKEETLQCKGVPPASERESIQSMKLTDSVQGSGARGASAPLRGSVAVNGNNPTKAGLLAGIQWLESTGE
jgi:hypothetical protein